MATLAQTGRFPCRASLLSAAGELPADNGAESSRVGGPVPSSGHWHRPMLPRINFAAMQHRPISEDSGMQQCCAAKGGRNAARRS